MPYESYNIADIENVSRYDTSMHNQLVALGFDRLSEIPKTFSLYQRRDGPDWWEEIGQSLQLKFDPQNPELSIVFTFNGLRDVNRSDFVLRSIGVAIYSYLDEKIVKKAEKSYSRNATFPTKSEMIGQIWFQMEQMQNTANMLQKQTTKDPSNHRIPGISKPGTKL